MTKKQGVNNSNPAANRDNNSNPSAPLQGNIMVVPKNQIQMMSGEVSDGQQSDRKATSEKNGILLQSN